MSTSAAKFLPGIAQRTVKTERLTVAYLEIGAGSIPIVLVHGNASSSLFYQDLMLALAAVGRYKVYARICAVMAIARCCRSMRRVVCATTATTWMPLCAHSIFHRFISSAGRWVAMS